MNALASFPRRLSVWIDDVAAGLARLGAKAPRGRRVELIEQADGAFLAAERRKGAGHPLDERRSASSRTGLPTPISARMRTLLARSRVRVILAPSRFVIRTLELPISTGSATVLSANNAVVNTVDYKNTGIILHVQPQVNSNGSVLLNIDQEISAVQPETGSTSSQNLTPTISERKVSSEISVVSGQTVLLAGLIQDQQEKSRQGIPVLNQLPYVGAAFGTTGTSQARTELIIFIRPHIIREGVDASMIAEEIRAKMRGGKVQAVTPAALNVNARPVQ